MSERSPQNEDKYVLRFPDGMRDTLKQHAADNKRSLNAEIIARLQLTLRQGALNELTLPEGRMQEIVERSVRRVLIELDKHGEKPDEA